MQVQFQCSLDDYREAHGIHAIATGQRPRSQRGLGLAILVLVIAIAGLLLLRAQIRPRPTYPVTDSGDLEPAKAAPPMTEWRFIRGVLPAIGFTVFFVAIVARQTLRKPAVSWEGPSGKGKRPRARAYANLTAFFMVAVVVYYVMTASDQTPALDVVPPFLPIALLVFGLIMITRLTRNRIQRRQWEAQPALHRLYTVDITAGGLSLEEPLARHEYKWEAVPGFRETANLFLVYVSSYAFWMIPKRSFQRLEDLDAFKGILLTQVRHKASS